MVDYKVISRHKNDISFEYGNGHKIPIKRISCNKEHDIQISHSEYFSHAISITQGQFSHTLNLELYNTNQFYELKENIDAAKICLYAEKECIIQYKNLKIRSNSSPDDIWLITTYRNIG